MEKINQVGFDEEKYKEEILLKPLESAEELRDWMDLFFDIRFPQGVVFPLSTHGPIDAMWRIYELLKTGKSAECPQITMLASRDSYKTLNAAALEVLLMIHFEVPLAHMAAIKPQAAKAIQYVNSFFRKIDKYLVGNGWKKSSDSKTYIEWITKGGETVYLNLVTCTIAGANCIVGKSGIMTENGVVRASKLFKQIQAGEKIKAKTLNIETNKIEYKNIVNSFKTSVKKKYIIRTQGGTLECSAKHKVWVKNKGWVEAQDLREGDIVLRNNSLAHDIEHVKKICKEKGFELLSSTYKNSKTPLKVRCGKGHVTMKKYSNIQSGYGCAVCHNYKSKLSIKEVQEICFKNNYTMVGKFQNADIPFEVKCNKGHITKKTVACIRNNKCLQCLNEEKALTQEQVSAICSAKGFKLKGDYKHNKLPFDVECSKGHVTQKFLSGVQGDFNCKECNLEDQRIGLEKARQLFKKNGFELLATEYINNHTSLKTKCRNGHILNKTYGDIGNGYIGCKHCQASAPQQEIYDFVKSIYQGEIRVNDRTVIKPLEIDIYMPELNFGIEFDGLYWHSTKVKSNIKHINKQKAASAKEIGLNLLCIFEDEWADERKKTLIKDMISYRLKAKKIIKLRPKELEIRKLNKNKEFSDFFNKFHLDGTATASFAYGFFHNGEMISCMSFRKSFSDKCHEIARFASNPNYLIHGGGSKLIKHAMKTECLDRLITFSNNRLSLGGIYKKSGFTEITKTTDPSYYYTDFKVRIWRYKCKRINDPEVIAKYPSELAQAEGGVFSRKYLNHSKPLYRVYDYGHRKWELKK